MKAWIIALFIIASLMYIANIVVVCCTGAELVNNISGWVCCIMLATSLFYTALIK